MTRPRRLAGAAVTRPRRLPMVALAGVVAVAAGGCGLSLQTLPKFQGSIGATYPVHVTFSDVNNLPVDAQVRIGSEAVGDVASIGTSGFAAQLVLDIKKGVGVPVGTTAQVRFDNPLGDEYVLLTPPAGVTAPVLAPGGSIPEADTGIAPSVEDTLGALSTVLNGGGIAQLQSIVHELNRTFDGNQPQIRDLLGQVTTAVTSLAGGRVSVDRALASIANLSKVLNQGSPTIAHGLDDIAPAVSLVSSQTSEITSLFDALDRLGQAANTITDQSGRYLVSDLNGLLPVAEQLVQVDAAIGPDLADIAALEGSTPKIAPGDYLQVGVTVNVLLPGGNYSPAGLASAARPATGAGATGSSAITALLEAGLA